MGEIGCANGRDIFLIDQIGFMNSDEFMHSEMRFKFF